MRLNTTSISPDLREMKTTFSIVIPFRNEEDQLTALLQSLAELDYPQEDFELILIDDDSTDASVSIIEGFAANHSLPLSILNNDRLSASPKKDALATGIAKARFEWIITTDADCILPKMWLNAYDSAIQDQPKLKFVAGPVCFFYAHAMTTWVK